jgi:hypothetical protein
MTLDIRSDAPKDFDFIIGTWRVKHRRLKSRLTKSIEWIELDGLSSTQKILGGFGNLEDNRLFFPEGEIRAVALRSFDQSAKTWSIWWLDGRYPAELGKPVVGMFSQGTGIFYGDDEHDGKPVKVRFMWLPEDSNHARWEQAFSDDGGQTWETNWTMEFSRVSAETF